MSYKVLFSALAAVMLVACNTAYRDQNPEPTETGAVIVGEEPPATDQDEYFRTDDQLHGDVHRALERAGLENVTVRVVNSDVFLAGHVHSAADRDRAHDIAHDVPGVEEVFVDEVHVD